MHFASVVDGSRKNVKLAKIATWTWQVFQVHDISGKRRWTTFFCFILFRVCRVSVEFRWSFGGSDRFEPSQSHRQVPLNRVRDVWGVGAEAGRHFVLHGICHIAPYCSILLLSYFVIFTSYLHKLHKYT